MHVAEEMDDMLGSGQQRQVALNDDPVKTVIYKNQEALKELREGFHRSPPTEVLVDNKIICQATDGIKPRAGQTEPPESSHLRSWRLGVLARN
jgi:hypothetical protein